MQHPGYRRRTCNRIGGIYHNLTGKVGYTGLLRCRFGHATRHAKNEQFTKPGDPISTYRNGKFVDFCRGPHVPSTGRIKAFKLLNIAGAYWLGDEKNPQLQRIYGTSFFNKKDLDQHLHMLEEAKKRDHRPQATPFRIGGMGKRCRRAAR